MRTLLVLLSTLLSSGLLFAQALTYPAECMVALLGRQPNDPEVEQVLAQAGILIPGDRKGSFDNLAQGYSMVLSATGAINSITFYNDSVKVGRKLYQGYKGALPFGFTFADSLGVEENLIFNQATTSYFEHDNYNRAHVPARTQKGLDYFIDCQYVAASQWYYMKQVNRAYRQRRTQ